MLEEFKNAFNRPNNAHVQLIIINVVMYVGLALLLVVFTISGKPEVRDWIYDAVALPAKFDLFIRKPWTLVTHAFVHDLKDFLHIFFNMLAVFWFGRIFIEYLGSDKLIALYVLGFLAGAVVFLLVFNTVPFFVAQNDGSGVGASAAVNAIVVGTATLLPNYTFFLLLIGPVRIKYIAAFFIFVSIIGTVGGNAGGSIAHLGGALMGFIYIKQLQVGVNWGGWITAVLDGIKSLFSPKPKVKVTYRSTTKEAPKKSRSASTASQAEIDAILDKISDKGYESLTKEEKEKLFNASKKQ